MFDILYVFMGSRIILSFSLPVDIQIQDSVRDGGNGDSDLTDSSPGVCGEGFRETSFQWLQSKRVSSNPRL